MYRYLDKTRFLCYITVFIGLCLIRPFLVNARSQPNSADSIQAHERVSTRRKANPNPPKNESSTRMTHAGLRNKQ